MPRKYHEAMLKELQSMAKQNLVFGPRPPETKALRLKCVLKEKLDKLRARLFVVGCDQKKAPIEISLLQLST